MNWLYLILAAVSGSAMALQGTFNAALGKIIGVWESTLLVHVIGSLAALIIILILGMGFSNYAK